MSTVEMCSDVDSVKRPLQGRAQDELVRLVALGMMTSGIVHDFGNLMQVVSSAIRLIEQKLDRPALVEAEPFIRGALQSVDRAVALSRQILSVSRADGAFEEIVNLNAALASMANPLCWTAGSNVRVELAVADDLPAVFCNIRELESALLNLVINAKDATPNGGCLRIAAHGGDFEDGATVILRVSDTGCGMSPEIAKRAFQPLFTTKPIGRGNGLGLAMVSEFVRRVGGSVHIEGAPNCGTSITLRLPACRN
jgi:signal transduction histidine kinase